MYWQFLVSTQEQDQFHPSCSLGGKRATAPTSASISPGVVIDLIEDEDDELEARAVSFTGPLALCHVRSPRRHSAAGRVDCDVIFVED